VPASVSGLFGVGDVSQIEEGSRCAAVGGIGARGVRDVRWGPRRGGVTYTFTLRDGVTFSNGEKFDAAVVKANFDHVADPKTSLDLSRDQQTGGHLM
jgi:hypothetical protein